MVSKGPGRQGYRWRQLAAKLKEELPPYCHICGEYIERALPPTEPMSYTLDHQKALSEDPGRVHAEDPANLRPAHRRCNSRRGNGKTPPPRQSRRW